MSSVYSLEPPTSGKVILKTNFGNIDVELFTREAPRACKNFIQLCLDGYYNNNVFFRIIKGFMIQTGDPTNTGEGGSSIWGKDFADEFHSRLRFNHRGVVAMANKNTPNTNGSQFFITMDKCMWLDKKHTIFGKVTGNTFFNALNISELETDKKDFPNVETLPIITEVEVVINPFDEIKPRKNKLTKEPTEQNENVSKTIKAIQQQKIMKNKNLISFGDDDDGDESEGKEKEQENEESVDNEAKGKEKKREPENESENNPESDEPSEESVSLSESNEAVIKARASLESKKKGSSSKKEEITQLKNEIQKIKQHYNPEANEQEKQKKNKLTPLQLYKEKFLQNKTKRLTKEEKMERITAFREKISALKKDNKSSWLTSKLKFQIDSQKAYALDKINSQNS